MAPSLALPRRLHPGLLPDLLLTLILLKPSLVQQGWGKLTASWVGALFPVR